MRKDCTQLVLHLQDALNDGRYILTCGLEPAQHAQEIRQDGVRRLWLRDTEVAGYADVSSLLIVVRRGTTWRDIHGKECGDGDSRLAKALIEQGGLCAEQSECVAFFQPKALILARWLTGH